ncbi:hypothetical protein Indivirus_4_48 [Indivirus ILV1]|uniref:AlgX/AlgJ SGNH hydrolase-like domain-containing protein n=1 Tax=Indivirus ILV1 TaxID=1977633 RepID=A0A1V0SDU0_9VIRU|nr:hypothetical protein Indivirus_4_48 [Indivirus ILV1]
MIKTLIGNNDYLFLISEVDQHFKKNIDFSNIEQNNNIIFEYSNTLKKYAKEFFMFIVPDKSIICKKYLPNNIDSSNIIRYADFLNDDNIIDLFKNVKLDENCYFKSDTHLNYVGQLLIAKKITEYLCNSEYDISNNLHYSNILFSGGDLTTKFNIGDSILNNYKEDVTAISINKKNIQNLTKNIPISSRYCFTRESKYCLNLEYKINKKLLIFGGSTSNKLIFDYLSLYFKECCFYWNHCYINEDIINFFKPDIIIDIRIERFIDIYSFSKCINIENPMLSPSNNLFSINHILNCITETYIDYNLYNNITINQIEENILVFSNMFKYYELNNTFNINNFKWQEYVNLNKDLYDLTDLNDFIYNDDKEIITNKQNSIKHLFFINHYIFYKENRKYKYENILDDFDSNIYKELNQDLRHMTYLEAKNHYEYTGYKENRKYKYENILDDFDSNIYKEVNPDLQHMTYLEAKNHYEYTGYKENRKYKYENIPDNFDANILYK